MTKRIGCFYMNEIIRRQRIQEAETYLHRNKISFERKNCGYHLIIRQGRKVINYWPTSYKYAYTDQPYKIYHGKVNEAINIIYSEKPLSIEELGQKDLETCSKQELIQIIHIMAKALNKYTSASY